MGHPGVLLDRPVADALVAFDHHESLLPDDREPVVVERSARNLRNIRVPGVHDARVLPRERLPEGQVVLVDEEPGRHVLLRHEGAELFLVRDRRSHIVDGEFVPVGDLLERLSGIVELPQPVGGNPLDRRSAEAHQRVDDHR